MKTKTPKEYFNFLKKRNVKRFSLFLLAAFFFLMLTKFSQSYTQSIDLKIEISNLEDEIIIVNDSIPLAQATIRSKGFNLLKYIFNNEQRIILSRNEDLSKTKNRFIWDIKANKYKLTKYFGNSIEVLSVKPDTVFFNFDKLASKKIPVIINADINFSEGYNIVGNLKLSQDSVKVIGSKKILDSIVHISTMPIELNDTNSNFNEVISLDNKWNDLEIIPEKLTLSGEVKRFTEGKFSVPVQLINTPKRRKINFFPKSVELVYYVDIDNYKSITREDFKVIADFSNLTTSDQNSLDLKFIDFPETVKNVRLLQNRIEFIITD